jgi:hypothetical protein
MCRGFARGEKEKLPENQKMRASTEILHDVEYQLIYFQNPDFKQMLT